MNDQTLLNRLNQPIPEKCPLSEAVVWLITGCLPTSLDDYKSIGSTSLHWGMEESSSGFYDDLAPKILRAFDFNGKSTDIDWDDFSAAKNKLLVALKNEDIRAWALCDDFDVKEPEKLERMNQQLTDIWDSYYEEQFLINSLDNETIPIPANMWSWELIAWYENILHCPLSRNDYFQFSDVTVSTKDLFVKFSDKNSILNSHKKERFWIPIKQALSLILTGKHNPEILLNDQKRFEKEAELIRILRNGKLFAEGYSGGNLETIENTSWTSDADIINDKIQSHYDIHVDEYDIRALFEIPEIDNNLPKHPEKTKRGRPPTVPKEVWLEELVKLFKSGEINKEDKTEAVAQYLIDAIKDNYGKTISIDTARKDWLRPLFKDAKTKMGENK